MTEMGRPITSSLPLIPLPRGLVLLPGVTLSIPILNRPDIASILALVLARGNNPRSDATSIGCVPLTSQLLNSEGQTLIRGKNEPNGRWADVAASDARKEDLFRYGAVARISAVQGGLSQDAVLVLEGVKRFRIDKIKQRKPFFEAEVTYIDEQGWGNTVVTCSIPADKWIVRY
jgi:ATP-dependent Lon protease